MGIPKHDTEGNLLPRNPMWTRMSSNIVRRKTVVSKSEPEACPFEADEPKILEPTVRSPAKTTVEELRTSIEAIPAKRGKGRPKKEGKRPWEEAGLSKSTWYEKKSKGEV